MNKQPDLPRRRPAGQPRRPYEKPGFLTSAAFERQALSCSGCLNLAPTPPSFCGLRS